MGGFREKKCLSDPMSIGDAAHATLAQQAVVAGALWVASAYEVVTIPDVAAVPSALARHGHRARNHAGVRAGGEHGTGACPLPRRHQRDALSGREPRLWSAE